MPLTQPELQRIRGAVYEQFPSPVPGGPQQAPLEPLPGALAPWLGGFVPGFEPGPRGPHDPPLIQGEVESAAVAFAYGPRDAGLQEQVLLSHLVERVACFTAHDDQRAVERLIRFGVLLSSQGEGWWGRWEQAYRTLGAIVERCVAPALAWFNDQPLLHGGAEGAAYMTVPQIQRWLVRGCECHLETERLSLQRSK
jgi:hypothetical protein